MRMPGFRRPSPALVISLIALFVALGGTGYAALKLPKNSVGSRQIRKNAVTSSKIKSNSVTASKIKNGSITSADINLATLGKVPSAANADHATTAGSAGSAAISQLTYVVANGTIPDNSRQDFTASCPAGTNVVGGGARVADPVNDFLNDTGPSGRTGWVVNAQSDTSGPGQTITVTAICAPAASTAP